MRAWKTILPVVLIAAYFATEAILSCRAKPPATVRTFDDYLQWQTTHRRIEVQQVGGQTFVLMQGPYAGILPSGPPAYVFDSAGTLVDWTTDGGDDGRFQKKWYAGPANPTVTLDEVKQLFATTKPAN